MRITNQILAKTALKSGIPLQQNSLLNMMVKQEQSQGNGLLSALSKSDSNKLTSAWQKLDKEKNQKLEKHASSLSEFASKLSEAGDGSLFAKAKESESTEDIVTNVQNMVEAYNNTLDQLKDSDSALNRFYLDELRSYVTDHKDALSEVGITVKSDGKLVIDEEKLKNADLETLEAVFGSESGFTDKLGFVGSRAAANAGTASNPFLNQYDGSGKSYIDSFKANQYDFWG